MRPGCIAASCSVEFFIAPVLTLPFLLCRGGIKTKEMTGGRNSSRWIHQRGNDSDMTGTQRGNGCCGLNLFGDADAGVGCVLLADQGWELSSGVDLQRNSQIDRQTDRVPPSVSLLYCRTSHRGQERAGVETRV